MPIKKMVNAGMTVGDGIGAWRILKEVYQGTSSLNMRSLFTSLVNIQMQGHLSQLHDYTYEFNRLTGALHGMLQKLNEQLLIAILLAGLTPAYEQIINILNANESLSLDDCIKQLKVFQETNKIDSKDNNPRHGINASVQPTGNTTGTGERIMNCYNCKKMHPGGGRKCTRTRGS